jgi:hypothetical protein
MLMRLTNLGAVLWLIRIRSEPRSKVYAAKQTAEGKSIKRIQRCLKRYIARELFPIIVSDLSDCAQT